MSTYVEQVEAAVREVDLSCGGNDHLLNDDMIGRIVEAAADGRQTSTHRITTGHAPLSAERMRVLPAHRAGSAREVSDHVEDSGVHVMTMCDRCDVSYDSTTGRVLWVPAGTAAVEFRLCLMCVDYLNTGFGPVTWRS